MHDQRWHLSARLCSVPQQSSSSAASVDRRDDPGRRVLYHKPTCLSGTPRKLTRRRGSPTTAGAQTRQPTTKKRVSDRPSTPADPCPLRRAFLFGPGSCRNAGHPVQLSAIPLESKDGGRAERGHRQANGRPKAHHVPRARSPAFWRNLVVSFEDPFTRHDRGS